MSAFEEDVQKTQFFPKRQFEEKTFYLSKLIKDGGCIHCINKTCRSNNPDHGIYFPEKLCCFVKNPSYIKEVGKALQDASLDFDGNSYNITTCIFIHNGKCKNCDEGRLKYFDLNGENISVCYPQLSDKTKTKITIGVHMDIKLIMKGKHYDVSALPIEKNDNIVKNNNIEKKEKNDEEESEFEGENFSNVLNIYYGNNKPSENIYRNQSFDSVKTQDFSVDDFPSLGNTPCPSPMQSNEKLPQKKNFADIIRVHTPKNIEEDNLNKLYLDTVNESKNRLMTPSPRFLEMSNGERKAYSPTTFIPISNENEDIVYDKKSFDKLQDENTLLKKRLESLKKENFDLYEENQKLDLTIKRNLYVIENELKIGEFLKNKNLLNNVVLEQFYDTHYSSYIVLD